jgi:TP901 family phage tail tape measure protein
MADALSDLYVILSLQNAPLMSGLDESATAGEEFAEKFLAGLEEVTGAEDNLAEAITRTGEVAAESSDAIAESAKIATDAIAGVTEAQSDAAAVAKENADAATGVADAQQRITDTAAGAAEGLQATAGASDEAAAGLGRAADAAGVYTDAQGRLRAANGRFVASETAAGDAAETTGNKTEESGDKAETAGGKFHLLGLALVAGAAISIKMAANFQQSMTRLVTSAGESQRNLAMVSQGIEQMSVATNTSMSQLASGMYYVESAGFHGANGLTVLKAAAEGAQAEGADLATVANAVTSALNAYGLKAGSATAVTDELVTAVGRGKMTMQDLASSISTVLPVAAKAGLSLAQVTGAIATMTSQGMSAQQASLDLRHAIQSLQNPTEVQSQELGQLGINSIDLAKNLGKNGLTGTLQQLEQAILQHMGPAGTVLLSAFNKSKLAAQSAQEQIAAMPPSLAKLAEAYQQGKISVAQWQQIMYKGSLPAEQVNLLKQFAATTNAAHGFNSQLDAGGSDAQTFNAALSKATGGLTSAQVALMLGGAHASVFAANVKAVGDSAQHAGSNVNNWGLIQKNFNFQLGQAGKAAQAMAVSFGQALLPAVSVVMHGLASFASMIARHTIACKALAVVVGVLLAGALEKTLVKGLSFATKGLKDMADTGGDVIKFFQSSKDEASDFSQMITKVGDVGKNAWSMLQSAWSGLAGLFVKTTAATEAQTAAEELQTAATEAQTAATEAATEAQEGLDVAMELNPIGLVIVAVAALVAGFILLWDHCKAFRDFWIDLWHDVTRIVDTAIRWIEKNWRLLPAIFLGPLGIIVTEVLLHLTAIEHAFEFVWQHIRGIVLPILHFIVTYIVAELDGLFGFLRGIWDVIAGVFEAAWDLMRGTVEVILDVIVGAIREAWTTISGIFEIFVDLLEGHWSAAWHELLSTGKALLGEISSMIRGAVSDFGTMLYDAGRNLVLGLIHGVESMVSGAVSSVEHLGSDVAGAFSKVLGIFSPSRVFYQHGRNIVLGLVNAMNDGRSLVVSASQRLAQAATGAFAPSSGTRLASLPGVAGVAALAAPAAGGGGTTQVNLKVEVPGGFVGSPQELVNLLTPVVQKLLLQYWRLNANTGTTPAH